MADPTPTLVDVRIPNPNSALAAILTGELGTLGVILDAEAARAAVTYQGVVARKTGKLASSATVVPAQIREVMKGQPRLVGEMAVGGTVAVAEEPWRGQPFYYGALHEFGNRKHPAHDDLVKVRDSMLL